MENTRSSIKGPNSRPARPASSADRCDRRDVYREDVADCLQALRPLLATLDDVAGGPTAITELIHAAAGEALTVLKAAVPASRWRCAASQSDLVDELRDKLLLPFAKLEQLYVNLLASGAQPPHKADCTALTRALWALYYLGIVLGEEFEAERESARDAARTAAGIPRTTAERG